MKKGAKAVLDGPWWSKHKSKTMKASGLGLALRNFESKVDTFDWDKALKELQAVKKAVEKARKLANPVAHAETLAVLKQYPAIIEKEEKRLKAIIAGEAEPEEAKTPKQQQGRPNVIWSKVLSREYLKKHGAKHPWITSFKGGKQELEINADIIELLENEGEAVLLQRMVDEANKVFGKSLEALEKYVISIEAKVKDAPKREAAILKAARMVCKDLNARMEEIPEGEWKKFLSKKQQYKDYKIRVGFDAALNTLKVVGAGAAVAGGVASGGAGLALALVGGIRTTADVVKQIRDTSQEAETVMKRVEKNLKQLNHDFVEADKHAKANAVAAGSVVGNTILNYPALPTLGTAGEDLALASDKTAGLNVAAAKLGKAVEANLKDVGKMAKLLKQAKDPKSVAKAMDQLRKVRGLLDKSLSTCSSMGGRVSKCEEALEKNQRLLELAREATSDHLKRFEKGFPIVVNLTLMVVNAGTGFSDASKAFEYVETSLGLANDLLEEVKDQVG